MPHFTLRDVFWLMLVAAMALAWWIDRGRLVKQSEAAETKVGYYERTIEAAREWNRRNPSSPAVLPWARY